MLGSGDCAGDHQQLGPEAAEPARRRRHRHAGRGANADHHHRERLENSRRWRRRATRSCSPSNHPEDFDRYSPMVSRLLHLMVIDILTTAGRAAPARAKTLRPMLAGDQGRNLRTRRYAQALTRPHPDQSRLRNASHPATAVKVRDDQRDDRKAVLVLRERHPRRTFIPNKPARDVDRQREARSRRSA